MFSLISRECESGSHLQFEGNCGFDSDNRYAKGRSIFASQVFDLLFLSPEKLKASEDEALVVAIIFSSHLCCLRDCIASVLRRRVAFAIISIVWS